MNSAAATINAVKKEAQKDALDILFLPFFAAMLWGFFSPAFSSMDVVLIGALAWAWIASLFSLIVSIRILRGDIPADLQISEPPRYFHFGRRVVFSGGRGWVLFFTRFYAHKIYLAVWGFLLLYFSWNLLLLFIK